MKRILSLAIVLVMVLAFVPCSTYTVKAEQSVMTLAQLQEKFPSNKYWNHVAQSGHGYNESCTIHYGSNCGDVENTCTDHPCYTHNGIAPVGEYDCNAFSKSPYGTQCCGFARKLGNDAYGGYAYWNSPDSNSISDTISRVKPGDIIHYTGAGADLTYGHWVFVIGVSGSVVTVGECNVSVDATYDQSDHCRILWGRSVNLNNVSSIEYYEAPYALTIDPPVSFDAAEVSEGTYLLKHNASGKYMTAEGLEKGSNVGVAVLSGDDSQKYVIAGSDKSYTLTTSFNSSFRINPNAEPLVNGAAIIIAPSTYESDNDQHWAFESVSGGYIIHNMKSPGFVLGVSGTNVQLVTYSGADDQIWSLIEDHNHTYGEWVTVTAATCTSAGVRERVCSCGDKQTETIPALGHDFGAWSVKTAATCTAKGVEERVCSRCGAKETREIAALGHNYVDGVCTVCGAVQSRAYVENVTAAPGDEINVGVFIENAPGVSSLAVSDITLDSPLLTLLGFKWDIEGLVLSAWDEDTGMGVGALSEAREIGGKIVTLTVRISEDAQDGEYTLDLTVMAKNSSGSDVEFSTVPGTITVSSILKGDVDGDGAVTDEDAIYLLFYTFFPNEYPINQNCDFNGDGTVSDEDAIYLLFFTFFPNEYPLH